MESKRLRGRFAAEDVFFLFLRHLFVLRHAIGHETVEASAFPWKFKPFLLLRFMGQLLLKNRRSRPLPKSHNTEFFMSCKTASSALLFFLAGTFCLSMAGIRGPFEVTTGDIATYTSTRLDGDPYWRIMSGGYFTTSNLENSVNVRWTTAGTHELRVYYGRGYDSYTVFVSDPTTCPTLGTLSMTSNGYQCPGQTVTYYAYGISDLNLTFEWSVFGGTVVSGGNGSSISVRWNDGARSGYISVKARNNCGNQSNLVSRFLDFSRCRNWPSLKGNGQGVADLEKTVSSGNAVLLLPEKDGGFAFTATAEATSFAMKYLGDNSALEFGLMVRDNVLWLQQGGIPLLDGAVELVAGDQVSFERIDGSFFLSINGELAWEMTIPAQDALRLQVEVLGSESKLEAFRTW